MQKIKIGVVSVSHLNFVQSGRIALHRQLCPLLNRFISRPAPELFNLELLLIQQCIIEPISLCIDA